MKAISFDADGTLWDFEGVMRSSLGYALRELDKSDHDAAKSLDVDRMIEIRDWVAERLRGKVSDLELVRLEAFKQALREVGRTDDGLAARLTAVYLKHRFEDIKPFSDVLPTLSILKDRYRLGVVSNGNSHPERCGLSGVFGFVVLSQDHGVEKPDPRIFEIALEEAGCSKGELLHVGDSLEKDVSGAIELGIRCVWLNRAQKGNDTDVNPEYEISSLLELLDIL